MCMKPLSPSHLGSVSTFELWCIRCFITDARTDPWSFSQSLLLLLLSRVYGSVTNNNGFWIGWLDLLTPCSTITLNQNQLKQLAINLQPNPSSLTVEDSLHSRSTTDFKFDWTTYKVSRRTHRKHIRCLPMDISEPHRKYFFCCQ
jgi:hypothetical protein